MLRPWLAHPQEVTRWGRVGRVELGRFNVFECDVPEVLELVVTQDGRPDEGEDLGLGLLARAALKELAYDRNPAQKRHLTDGVTDVVSDEEILRISKEHTDLESLADTLISTALENGSQDNITVLLAQYTGSSVVKPITRIYEFV